MKNKRKIKHIIQILEDLFPNPPIPLIHSDAYTLLVSVLLSAQCTDERVNRVTPILFNKASNPYEMIKLNIEEIKDIIKICGLANTKAKAIYNLSKILIEKHNGKVPKTFAELEQLPGVGHKTASVVMSQAWGIPAFPVDTHIHRLATRWRLTSGKNVEQTEKDLKALIPAEKWNTMHLQIIYFGRKYCSARVHIKENCPICSIYG